MDDLIIRPLVAKDADMWRVLYRLYAEFYQTSIDGKRLSIVWQWLQDSKLQGCGAFTAEGQLVGIAHYEQVLRPLHAAQLAYLNDLLTVPEYRGKGVGRQLIEYVSAAAKNDGCSLLRWATAADNTTAMALYDNIARKTSWVLYERDINNEH